MVEFLLRGAGFDNSLFQNGFAREGDRSLARGRRKRGLRVGFANDKLGLSLGTHLKHPFNLFRARDRNFL